MQEDIEKWYHDRRYSQIENRYPDKNIFPKFYKANRQEFILRPGEMIFIPAGMFHFVFSEDSDPETGLCAAINFWYESPHGDEGNENEKPKFGWHNIHKKFDKIIDTLKKNPLRIVSSSTKIFPPYKMSERYTYIKEKTMSFEDFYEAKNSCHYLPQYKSHDFEEFAIPYKTPLIESTVWINWGNCNTLPHYDGMDNWLCQLKGTRRIILIPQTDRDLLYLINPYPIKLLDDIYKKCQKDVVLVEEKIETRNKTSKTIHRTKDLTIKDKLLQTIGDEDEIIIMCKDLEISYEKNISIHQPEPHMKWKTFMIKKYKTNEYVTSFKFMNVMWFLTDCKIDVNDTEIDVEAGETISSLPTPVKVLSDGIIIIPHGSDNGM